MSTDKFARGMDIPNVKYVVSYDMPKDVKGYIHRVGRTGRAGQQGTAVTMVHHTQVALDDSADFLNSFILSKFIIILTMFRVI